MADTVKKSRIVSDPECLATYADNLNTEDTSLQDIINQEFNQRLKSCMQNEPYLEPNEEHLALTYEQGEVVLKNGDLKAQITQPTTLELNTETSVLTTKEPEEENGENEVLKTQDKESTPTTDNKGLNGNITAQNIPEEPSINNDKHSTNGLHHSEINPPTLETDQLCEKVQDQTSPDDSFINKEIPSPEDEIESPFDNITVTDVDNENLTAKERFLSTIKDIDDDDINAKLATVKDRMFLSTDSAILFTQTVVQSPMLTPTEESYDFLQALGQNSSDTNVTILEDQNSSVKIEENSLPKEDIVIVADKEDKDEISEISAENEVCNKLDTSISEEDVSECFKNEENLQQLDESEENMKEITSKFIENEISETDGELLLLKSTVASKTIPIVKTPTIVEHLVEDVDPEEEDYIDSFNRSQEIYEAEQHLEEALKENTTEEEIKDLPIDNSQLEDIKSSEEVSENKILEKPTKFDSTVLELSLTKPHSEESEHKAETAINNEEENEEIVKSPTKVSEISKIFTPKDSESPKEETKSPVLDETFEDIKKTKEIFERISFTGSDEPKTNLKSCEMVKRLSDPLSPGSDISDCGDPTNTVCRSDFSTTTTSEASFVETRTEINSNQDKVLKKKKSKKSKKDNEKENISVCDYTNTNDDDTLSHVSVKNLCRSFSDLTSIGSKNVDPKLKARITTGRTKSMSDIRRDDITLENVFSNVSVKTLRECFDNLTNRTTNQCFERSSLNNHIKPIVTTSDRIEKLKSSFSKFDALQKKTVLHVRSSDSGKAQEKFNGTTTQVDTSSCKSCSKQVFQMEQIKAEKAIWHKNCFRCKECNKQLNVDTYQSNEGVLYCKPHFKALFTPKAVEDEPQPIRPRKHELIIRENQPEELPPDVVRASDKPDLGLEELQNLNVKERFQVFEQHDSQENNLERTPSAVNVKRSPSILSKLAKFQSKGMDIGVADDSLNGIPVEESSSEEEEEEEEIEGEDADLVRAKRAQREKPLHFNNMSDIMSKWESGNQMTKEERREERKQEIQSIRSRLFMGKQAKIKEMYQQAVADSSSGAHVRKQVPLDTELCEGARTLRERFERGEQLTSAEQQTLRDLDDAEVFESGISKKSRSIFQELDANASKPPMIQQAQTKASTQEVRRAREAFMARQASDDIVRSSDQVDDVTVKTADISSRFKFFETYKEPEKQRKQFRITPPRDGKDKLPDAPEEENAPPEIIEPDTAEATASHTATRMLNMFRQMEESAGREQMPTGPKPLKRFTPPPEPQRPESESEGEYSEEEDDEEDDAGEQRNVDEDLIEAQKAARAKHLRAKFEKWEANEIKREQNNSSVNIAEEMGDADSQIESAKSLCARFESMRETSTDKERTPRVKVNRFVDTTNNVETCKSCEGRVYPLEKVSCHNNIYHKNCFRCRECNTILR